MSETLTVEQAERERLDRVMQASQPRTWPVSKGPHGFRRGQ
jgi:hypothetical protein